LNQEGGKFQANKWHHLFVSFVHVSQNLVIKNGQKLHMFKQQNQGNYNKHKLISSGERPTRSTKTKWGIIKHYAFKLVSFLRSFSFE
jgi:hypothetical protein